MSALGGAPATGALVAAGGGLCAKIDIVLSAMNNTATKDVNVFMGAILPELGPNAKPA
jgi:hypothetical protein